MRTIWQHNYSAKGLASSQKRPTFAARITHAMDKEIAFPHAKINLGLFVTRRREDGYHILQTLFYPIDWCDALEVLPLSDAPAGTCRLVQTGLTIDGDAEQNLCVRAYRRLQRRYPDLPGVEMHLEKRIPFGAGLGGGSSDGAHALLMLRRLFGLDLTDAELEAEAAAMGADCAFFCRTGAQYCEGVGHEMEPYPLTLHGLYAVVVKPPFGVSTREAYAGVRPQQPAVPLCDLLQRPIAMWRDTVANDFEASVFPLHPELAEAKQRLYAAGAVYASMSGSGSALFGLFESEPAEAPAAWFPAGWEARSIPLR